MERGMVSLWEVVLYQSLMVSLCEMCLYQEGDGLTVRGGPSSKGDGLSVRGSHLTEVLWSLWEVVLYQECDGFVVSARTSSVAASGCPLCHVTTCKRASTNASSRTSWSLWNVQFHWNKNQHIGHILPGKNSVIRGPNIMENWMLISWAHFPAVTLAHFDCAMDPFLTDLPKGYIKLC